MSARKSVLKVFIIIILAVFLLSTGLISVLYLWGKGDSTWTGDTLSWDITSWTIVDSWISDTTSLDSETLDSGATELPQITREEAAKKMQELLSGTQNN